MQTIVSTLKEVLSSVQIGKARGRGKNKHGSSQSSVCLKTLKKASGTEEETFYRT